MKTLMENWRFYASEKPIDLNEASYDFKPGSPTNKLPREIKNAVEKMVIDWGNSMVEAEMENQKISPRLADDLIRFKQESLGTYDRSTFLYFHTEDQRNVPIPIGTEEFIDLWNKQALVMTTWNGDYPTGQAPAAELAMGKLWVQTIVNAIERKLGQEIDVPMAVETIPELDFEDLGVSNEEELSQIDISDFDLDSLGVDNPEPQQARAPAELAPDVEPESDSEVAAEPEQKPNNTAKDEDDKIIAGINSDVYPDSLINLLKPLNFLTKDEKGQILRLMLKSTQEDDIVLEAIGDSKAPRTFSSNTTNKLNKLIASFQLPSSDLKKLEKTLTQWAKLNTVKFSPGAAVAQAEVPAEPPPPAEPEKEKEQDRKDPRDLPDDRDDFSTADVPELPPLTDPGDEREELPPLTDPEQEPEEEPEPEADDEKDGGFMDAMERGVLKVAYALYGTREEPNALGKMMRKAEMAAQSWMAPGSPTAYTNDEKIIDILFDVNDGLNDNKATRGELTTYEINKLMKHLVKELELEGQGLSEGLISEASAWETLKYLASKAGRMEKGGKFIGRGKADAENKAKIEKQLANPATKLVGQLKKKLEDEYPDFPNNKGTTNFGLAIIEIWIAYDSIVNAVKTGKMEPVAANAIIRALYDLVDRYANYELSDVGRHFTEGQLYGPGVRDEVMDQLNNAPLRNLFIGDPDRGLQFAKNYNPTPAEIEVLAKSVGYNPENASAIADAFSKGTSYTGGNVGIQTAMANPNDMAKVAQAVEAGAPVEDAAEAIYKNKVGQPLPDWAQDVVDRLDAEGAEYVKQPDGSLRRSFSRVTGEKAKVSKAAGTQTPAAPAEIPAEAVEQAEEATKKVLNELPPEELEKIVGSGATDLSTFQVANFWLTQFALPAIIYSRVAIKLLRAKGKHSSREKELKKLLSGIDVVPERTGEAEEETDVKELAKQVASITGNDVASKLYKKLDSELKRLGYEDVLNEKNGKSQIIDLSDIEIPPDKFDEVAKLLLKSLKGVGLDINLGGKVLNAADYGPKGGGVDLSPISDYIKDVDLAMAVKKIIYQVLIDRNIPVQKVDMSENKIFARWRELVQV